MPLPPVIEIVPSADAFLAEVTVPGSKSITNRALIVAALAGGDTTLRGALWSEDTQVMVEALRALGFQVDVQPEPSETANRTIRVNGQDGRMPRAGTDSAPLELFVGNAGTAARFLAALVCLGRGVFRLSGVPRMHERPQAALFDALRQLGYRIESPNDRLPALIHGEGPRKAECEVSIADSSQFASALLLCAERGGWQVRVTGDNAEESPYVAMTSRLLARMPGNGGEFQIEPDASSGSYFWAANDIQRLRRVRSQLGTGASLGRWPVRVKTWPQPELQIDASFPAHLQAMALGHLDDGSSPRPLFEISRRDALGDAIMTLIALSPLMDRPCRFTDLGRLRLQECERVAALRAELTKCGGTVEEDGDTLTVHPTPLHGAEIETYQDHRMAMCFATLGLRVPGMRIKNPACVNKTFPTFFQKLAAPPPAGLGATILAAGTACRLTGNDLLAG